jgi:hypothetical protein
MQKYSEAVCSAARGMRWHAHQLTGVYRVPERAWFGWMRVPPHWTAWLLMEKAGMPRDLIAFVARVEEGHVARALRITTALMVFPPYAARIERLGKRLGLFGLAEHRAEPRVRAA